MSLVTRTVAVSVFCVVAGVASAERLPKDAVKLSPAEAKAIYSGKSSDWSRSNAYFAPDGRYIMVSKKGTGVAEGKWTVSGNKVCAMADLRGLKDDFKDKINDCWTWYKHGKRHLSMWSGDKNGKDGWFDGEMKKLSKGDKVSKKFQKLVASN